MKTMTCKQLGGACDMAFRAETFEEIAEMSKNHGMEMSRQRDKDHLAAMQRMQEKMKSPDEMYKWMEEKRREFNALPDS